MRSQAESLREASDSVMLAGLAVYLLLLTTCTWRALRSRIDMSPSAAAEADEAAATDGLSPDGEKGTPKTVGA